MEAIYGVDGFPRIWSDWNGAMNGIYRQPSKGDICRDALPLIRCQTLILHGLKDDKVTKEQQLYLRDNIAGSEYVAFPDGRHDIHIRSADEFNKLASEFLQRQ